MLNKENLHSYQKDALMFLLTHPNCALFMEMGLGKTITVLTYISDCVSAMGDSTERYLIVAPLRVANTVWKQEAVKWEHTKNLDIAICTGTETNRKKIIDDGHKITVINRENIPWLVKNYQWNWSTLIIDESSSFKSHQSIRFKALKSVKDKIRNTILLTGTPAPNGYMDLWSQFYLLDKGARLGKNITSYRNRFFYPTGYGGYQWALQKGEDKTIQEKIKDLCLTLKFEDHIDIPEKIDIKRYVELPKKHLAQYKELEKEFLLTLEDSEIEALSAASLANKLLQFCNGALYDAEQKVNIIHDEKIKELQQILEDNPNDNFLIAYNYKHDLERIKNTVKNCVVLSNSGKEVEDWNNGKIKYLVTHPASSGHGLNLQKGGHSIIWFGMNWNLEYYEQFNSRLYRQGQQQSVKIIHLIVKGGIDEKVHEALLNKAKTQNELKTYLKRTL